MFYLDADSWASADLLINVLSLSNIILIYSKCISDCPWPCSTGSESAKSNNRGTCIVATDIRSICAKDTCISSSYTFSTWIGCFGVGSTCIKGICTRGTSIRGVEPRPLAISGIIWHIKDIEPIRAGLGVIVCYFRLSMKLIFAFTKEMSC